MEVHTHGSEWASLSENRRSKYVFILSLKKLNYISIHQVCMDDACVLSPVSFAHIIEKADDTNMRRMLHTKRRTADT